MVEQKRCLSVLRNFTLFFYRRIGSVWIGYNDQKQEGKWEWINPSGGCKKFTNWNGGEPNGGRGENCVELYKDHGGKWNDRSCNGKLAYICEFGNKATKLCPRPPPPGKYINLFHLFLITSPAVSKARNRYQEI